MPVSYGRIKPIKERKGLIVNMYHFPDSAETAKAGWRDRSQACMCPALTYKGPELSSLIRKAATAQ